MRLIGFCIVIRIISRYFEKKNERSEFSILLFQIACFVQSLFVHAPLPRFLQSSRPELIWVSELSTLLSETSLILPWPC